MTLPRVPSLSVAELPDDAALLDVRESDEWAAGHAPTAMHIPMGEIPTKLDQLPADGVLHVVCRSGGRSARVVAYLNQAGWDAVNVDGGMQAWSATGLPMTCEGSGETPQVL